MAKVKTNILANLIGSIWQVLVGLLFVPFYVKFMGVESYGLVGIFVTLQTLAGVLEMGLGNTINREMARRSVLADGKQEIRNLVRSLEVIYWCVAIFIGLAIIIISPFVAEYWVKAQGLPSKTVEQATLIMGLIMTFHWPASLYTNGLYGMQRHVLLNTVNVCIVTVRGLGAVFILWQISPTIQAFLLWQIFISATHTILNAFFLWQIIPPSENKPMFKIQLIKSVGRFAVGIASVTILSVVISQLDKIILSKMLPLEIFGYYALAGVVAMSPLRIALPVFWGIYPKFTQLVSLANYEALRNIYHKSCQLMAVLILPFAAIVAIFSYELVLLWTQSPLIAEKSHMLVSILICGTALNALLEPPHALQMAFGWTRLLFFRNLFVLIALVPLIIYMTNVYGAIGAALTWVIVNLGGVLFEVPLMHRRILCGEEWKWYAQDVFIPLIASLLISASGRILMPPEMSQMMTIIYLVFVSVTTLVGTALVTPVTRVWLYAQAIKIIKC